MYPVDLHTHTLASTHAYSSIMEYVALAKQRGIRLFANTDHGPDMADAPHYWHFMNLRVLPRIVDGVGILRGIEANIKNEQGETDCSPQMREQLDLIMAGFHEPVLAPQDKATNTRTLIATIASEKIHIINHPGNPKYPIDIQAVAEAAAQYRVALEINNSSFICSRIGSEPNCRLVAQAVKDAGGLIAIGSDSHIAYSLGNFDEALRILEDIDFPEDRILNVTPRRLLDYLESHGGKPIIEFADF